MSLATDVARLRAALAGLRRAIVGLAEDGVDRLEARRCAKLGRHGPARDAKTGAIVCVYCRTPLA